MRPTVKTLDALAEILVGVPGLGETGEHAFRVIQPNSFSDTGVLATLETQFRKEDVSDRLRLQASDILVKRLNPSFVYVVSDGEEGAVASQNLLVIRARSGVEPLYLACLLEQKEVIGQVEHMSGTAAAIKLLTQKKLAEIQVPVISIEGQRKLGELWLLARRQKALLREYMAESGKLVSMLISKITTIGGKEQ